MGYLVSFILIIFTTFSLTLWVDVRVDNEVINKAGNVCINNNGLQSIIQDNWKPSRPRAICNNGAVFELKEDKQ